MGYCCRYGNAAGKFFALIKSHFPNAGKPVRYACAGKVAALAKSTFPYAGNAVGYVYAGKAAATGKSAFPNGGNAVRYGYAGKFGLLKSPVPNTGNAVRYGERAAFSLRVPYQGSFIFVIQYAVLRGKCAVGGVNIYCGKAFAAQSALNAGNAAPYCYAGKFATGHKSAVSVSGNAVGYSYAGKTSAIKSYNPNAGNAVGYGYAGKSAFFGKSAFPNAGNAVRYGYAGTRTGVFGQRCA